MKNLFWFYTIPSVIQLGNMLSDIIIILAVVICAKTWGIFGLPLALFLAIPPTRQTGGLFFSWRPKNIKSFWQNWRKIIKEAL